MKRNLQSLLIFLLAISLLFVAAAYSQSLGCPTLTCIPIITP